MMILCFDEYILYYSTNKRVYSSTSKIFSYIFGILFCLLLV